jgi:DNA-directed RNA polymerase specialized sigma subunit
MDVSGEELVGLIEEVSPVRLVSLDEVAAPLDFREDSWHGDFIMDSLHNEFTEDSPHDIIPDDSCGSAFDALEHKEIISLLVERIAQLPELQKKVLTMYYYENMPLSKIAAIFGVTESCD